MKRPTQTPAPVKVLIDIDLLTRAIDALAIRIKSLSVAELQTARELFRTLRDDTDARIRQETIQRRRDIAYLSSISPDLVSFYREGKAIYKMDPARLRLELELYNRQGLTFEGTDN